MSTTDITVSGVEPIRLASLSGFAASSSSADVAPVIGPLFGELMGAVSAAGAQITGPPVAYYRTLRGGRLEIIVGCPVSPEPTESKVTMVDLPGWLHAATCVHQGPMESISESYEALGNWIVEEGYETDGTARETYLRSYPEPEESWQTLIQMPVSQS